MYKLKLLLVLEEKFQAGGGNDRDAFSVVFLEPILRSVQKVADKRFLHKGEDDLESDQNREEDDDVLDLKAIARQLRAKVREDPFMARIHRITLSQPMPVPTGSLWLPPGRRCRR